MKYYDIALFSVDKGLQKRLGYESIYTVGKEIFIQDHKGQRKYPTIIRSADQTALIKSLKDSAVIGVIIDDDKVSKKVIEKVAQSAKTLFLPLTPLIWEDVNLRQKRFSRLRQVLGAAHKFKAKTTLITLSENKEPYATF